MKIIEIKGKPQRERIEKAISLDNNLIPMRTKFINLPDEIFEYKYQISLINNLYLKNDIFCLQQNTNNDNYLKILELEIIKKLNSYKNQDKIKNKYNEDNINYENVVEKLVASKLTCFYCKNQLQLLYKKVRENMQWTLDRIDNNLPHKKDNVVICCLTCNLKRRNQDDKKFKQSKDLKIIKKE